MWLAQASQPASQPAPAPVDQLDRLVTAAGLDRTFADTPWTAWVVLLAAIFGGLLVGRVLSGILRGSAGRADHRSKALGTALSSAAAPVSVLALAIGLSIGLQPIVLSGGVRDFAMRVLNLLYVVAVGWFLYNLVEIVDHWMRTWASKSESKLDDQLAPMVRKTLRIFLVVILVLYTAENVFHQDITAWLTGLGIAGLAVSLAAQDSIKNLFGSITIFLDRPFAVGDRIVFDGHDGPVEEIGFRSTKIRTLSGDLVTVPNARIVDQSVRNIGRRPSIQRVFDIGVPQDTPIERVESAVGKLRALLTSDEFAKPFDMQKSPPKVYFDEIRAEAFNIKVYYWYTPPDWWGYCDHAERLNLAMVRLLNDEGIVFDLPTRKTLLVGDPRQPVAMARPPANGAVK